jgi:PhzF family phenazine biosynthesis protein
MNAHQNFNIQIFNAFCGFEAKGNPAGVTLLKKDLSDDHLQQIAQQVNLSETAFLLEKEEGHYQLRWFTPQCEVDLCGHATLAATDYLANKMKDVKKEVVFFTRSGKLLARKIEKNSYELDLPRDSLQEVDFIKFFEDLLGCDVLHTYRGKDDFLILLSEENSLLTLTPSFKKLEKVPSRGVIVTSSTQKKGFDFVSRFFAPQSGINEDPVTGSAHCSLAEYWSPKLKKVELKGYQASERGGVVQVKIKDKKVYLSGEVRHAGSMQVKLEL